MPPLASIARHLFKSRVLGEPPPSPWTEQVAVSVKSLAMLGSGQLGKNPLALLDMLVVFVGTAMAE
jgi:hypothetical protein